MLQCYRMLPSLHADSEQHCKENLQSAEGTESECNLDAMHFIEILKTRKGDPTHPMERKSTIEELFRAFEGLSR